MVADGDSASVLRLTLHRVRLEPGRGIPEGGITSSKFVHTLQHYTTLHYIPKTHDFAAFYCVFRTFVALVRTKKMWKYKVLLFG